MCDNSNDQTNSISNIALNCAHSKLATCNISLVILYSRMYGQILCGSDYGSVNDLGFGVMKKQSVVHPYQSCGFGLQKLSAVNCDLGSHKLDCGGAEW